MDKLANGCTIDPRTRKFLPADKEKTEVLGVRLPISLIQEINQFSDKPDWLKQIITEAVRSRLRG